VAVKEFEESVRDHVARFGEIALAGVPGSGPIRHWRVNTAVNLLTQEAQLDPVTGGIFGVPLKTCSLEVLNGEIAFPELVGDRVAKDVQAASILPEIKEPADDGVTCLGKVTAAHGWRRDIRIRRKVGLWRLSAQPLAAQVAQTRPGLPAIQLHTSSLEILDDYSIVCDSFRDGIAKDV
jgi:hypothetical protein